MPNAELNTERIDLRRDDARRALAALRERLSPRAGIVSEAGRRRTIEIFGEPLTPQQVVERISDDVRNRGLSAVLDYSARIDKAQFDGGDDPRSGGQSCRRACKRRRCVDRRGPTDS